MNPKILLILLSIYLSLNNVFVHASDNNICIHVSVVNVCVVPLWFMSLWNMIEMCVLTYMYVFNVFVFMHMNFKKSCIYDCVQESLINICIHATILIKTSNISISMYLFLMVFFSNDSKCDSFKISGSSHDVWIKPRCDSR